MPKTIKAKPQGRSVEERIADAYQQGMADGRAEEKAKFAPDPLYMRDLSELVRCLDAVATVNRGKGVVVVNYVGEHGIQHIVAAAPVFNLIVGELSRLGYGP